MVIVTWWTSYRLHAFRLHSSLHSSWLWRQESSSGEFTSNICCLSDIVIITQSTWKANFHVYSGESHPNIRLYVAKRLRLTSALTSLVTERIDWFDYFILFIHFYFLFILFHNEKKSEKKVILLHPLIIYDFFPLYILSIELSSLQNNYDGSWENYNLVIKLFVISRIFSIKNKY